MDLDVNTFLLKKKFVFTDIDLDGSMSYLVFSWLTGHSDIPYSTVRVNDCRPAFSNWLKTNNPKKYDQIYVFDLDTSDCIDLIDLPNVVIIDHHTSHVENKHKYKKAKTFINEQSSCCKHIYNLLHKKVDNKLTDQQKHLLLLADDYDCYKLALKDTLSLNFLFRNYQGDRLRKFINDFGDGFSGFTKDQNAIIQFYHNKLNSIKSELQIHAADIPIKKKTYKFVSTFASDCINEVAEHIIKDNRADVGLVVNLKSNKVSFRKNKSVDLDLSQLAQKLSDEGGGHKYAAGGSIGSKFLQFTKLFKPVP